MNGEEIFQPELLTGERILWTGQPNPRIIFAPYDFFMVPFSLLWGGFALFWEAGVLGLIPGAMKNGGNAPFIFPLFGSVFVAVGLYFIIGRFFYKVWNKKRTWYALTNHRAIIISSGRSKNVQTANLDSLAGINKTEGTNGHGSILFGSIGFPMSAYQNTGMDFFTARYAQAVPAFFDIADVNDVYRLACEQRKAKS